MKTINLFFLFSLCSTFFMAQNFNLRVKSGDAELDASLDHINVKAKADLPGFKSEIALEFGVSEQKIDKMINDNISPADVFMTFQVAELSKKEPETVLATFTKNTDKGWGALAKELGIKPGSAEFHALKGKAKNKKDKGEKGKGNGKGNGEGKGKNK
ncbi:MAG: hypothetical protein IPM51_05720 [Sphingobacteriaceae bacterium]|nr:hypothetical protein [Sphingobacteriaceae bacterium]